MTTTSALLNGRAHTEEGRPLGPILDNHYRELARELLEAVTIRAAANRYQLPVAS